MSETATAGVFRIFNAFSGSERALKRFLHRFISNRDDIEDICQETLVCALEAERSQEIIEPRAFLFGGGEIGPHTLLRFYILHCIFIPLVASILMAVHFWRIRRDGFSGPSL